MTVREKYQKLSSEQLLDKAYELGWKYYKNSQSSSQSVVATFHELLDFDGALVRAATSSCCGQAMQSVGTCGAIIGGTIVLDYFFGRPAEHMSNQEYTPANTKPLRDAIEVAKLLYDRFIKKYGTIVCPHIQVQLFGRHYYVLDPDEMQKFEKAGGGTDPTKCCHLVGHAARWVMEILLDKGAVQLDS